MQTVIREFLFDSWDIITAVCGVVGFFVGIFVDKGKGKNAFFAFLAIFCLLCAYVGLSNVKVPNICGKTAAEAKQILTERQLKWELHGAYDWSSDLYKYKVIKQSHYIGNLVKKGTVITVVVEPDPTEL